ncbi:hypothetical protein [Desulfovermiculus halophilus]|nr:hypothetical protein [Desulfovermiculus halophilus]
MTILQAGEGGGLHFPAVMVSVGVRGGTLGLAMSLIQAAWL